jgi:hypothetical protein
MYFWQNWIHKLIGFVNLSDTCNYDSLQVIGKGFINYKLRLFGFPTFRLLAYLMMVIPETRRAH